MNAHLSSPPQEPEPEWRALVARIRADDTTGMEELYAIFSRGVRYTMWRQIGPQDLEDRVHETFLIVTQAIRNGELREPERLMGFVRTVVRRQVASYIDDAVQNRRRRVDVNLATRLYDRRHDPEWAAILRQEEDVAHRVLAGVSKRDREILIRFYLKEQTQQEICSAMKLSETQFRLLKSRAKARFAELGKRRLVLKILPRTE